MLAMPAAENRAMISDLDPAGDAVDGDEQWR
jgi:hypothetical protein